MNLAAYLELNELSYAQFGAQCKPVRTSEAVRLWATSQRMPQQDSMIAILKVTNGAVHPNDFYGIGCRTPTKRKRMK